MAYKYTTGSVNRGDLYAESSIDDDGDTYINFGSDSISLVANAVNTLTVGTAGVVLNEGSDSAMDFRVESNTNANMIFVDAGNDQIGIGTGAPTSAFHVSGSQAGNYFGIANNTHTPYALDETHYIVHYYGTGNATIELPAVANCIGRIYHIITNCGGSGDEVTIEHNSSETIKGANVQDGSTAQLGIDGQSPQSVTIVSTGAHWHILSDARSQHEE